MSNEVKLSAAVLAVLTVIATGLAFGEELLKLMNSLRPEAEISTNSNSETPEQPEMANFSVEVDESTNPAVEAVVSLNGDDLTSIFSYEEPHRLTETVPEARYNYSLTVTYYEPPTSGASQYSSQYSTEESPCEPGTVATGSGELSINDGDQFQVFFDGCEEATLQQMG